MIYELDSPMLYAMFLLFARTFLACIANGTEKFPLFWGRRKMSDRKKEEKDLKLKEKSINNGR